MIFVDTSAFIALADQDDRHHKEAVRIAGSIRSSIKQVTTNLVFSETVTYFNRVQGPDAAYNIGRNIQSSRSGRGKV